MSCIFGWSLRHSSLFKHDVVLRRVGEFDAEKDGSDSEGDREYDFEQSEVCEAGDPERVGVFGEGGEGGESAEEASGEEGEDPGGGGFVGEASKENSDEEATEQVASEDAHGEAMERGFFGKGLDAGRKTVAGEGT